MSKVRINDTFILTGRGLTFVGELLEGNFFSGDIINFEVEHNPYRLIITSWEMAGLKTSEQGNPIISFLVRANEQETKELYQNPQLKGVVAKIHSKG